MNDNLIWIDLEMTGLDVEKHVILEIASIVTDGQLRTIAEGPVIAIHYTEETLALMDEWSREHHQASGLLDRVERSKYDCRHAELESMEFISTYSRKGQSPLCGNSIWQDRLFLKKYMRELEDYLHYRNIDVSSVKELAKRWYATLPPYKKRKAHLAKGDIMESIEELKYYRQQIFVENPLT